MHTNNLFPAYLHIHNYTSCYVNHNHSFVCVNIVYLSNTVLLSAPWHWSSSHVAIQLFTIYVYVVWYCHQQLAQGCWNNNIALYKIIHRVLLYGVFVPHSGTGCRTVTLVVPHCHCGLLKIWSKLNFCVSIFVGMGEEMYAGGSLDWSRRVCESMLHVRRDKPGGGCCCCQLWFG